MSFDTDVAVIGGGPAGSAAAITLRQAGLRVMVLERERFPRFHVGESLLPLQGAVLDRLGVSAKLAEADFVPKLGARFLANDGSVAGQIDFGDLLSPPHNFAYQVERSRFDQILLDCAREQGATVLEEHAVVEAELGEDHSRLRVRGPGRQESWLTCRFVLDASGQSSFLAKKLGLRQNTPGLRKVAHFAHFEGGQRWEGRRRGDISLIFGRGCWFWHIPLSDNRASVGMVVDHERWKASQVSAEQFLADAIASSPWLSGWLGSAQRVTEVHTVANFSYTAERFGGPGFLLVGDAATFLDPIFSTGVLLALVSGEHAAKTIARPLLAGGSPTASALQRYEKTLRRWTKDYFRMIHAFYQPEFPSIFLSPVRSFQRPVTYFLAGGMEMSLSHRLVVEIFLLLVKLNRNFRFARDPRSPEAAVYHG